MKSGLTPLGLALVFAGTTFAAFNPVPLAPSSFNADVVVEKTATPALKVVTTASVDQGTNNGAATWMEVGFDPANPGNGLPAAGTIIVAISNANYSFQMPPSYTAPNGILINATQVTNGTFTLTTPAAYTLLSFLGSGGNGGDFTGVKVYHQDGTTESGSFGVPDWFNGTSNVAFIANIRAGSTVNLTSANNNSGNPRLYFRDVVLTNTTSPVTKVDLFYISGPVNSHNDIVAMSGATTAGGVVAPIAVTGYTYDFVVEAGAAKRGRVVSANIVDGTNVWATSQSMDNTGNTDNAWFERGYNVNNPDGGGIPIPDPTVITNTGIPEAGTTISNAAGSHVYTMPPSYTANNAVYLSTTITNATITPVTPLAVTPVAPATATVLSFLAAAGNGPVTPQVIINYQDGTSETNILSIPDWGNTTLPFVHLANGRIDVDSAQLNDVRAVPLPRFMLFNRDLVLAKTTSAITSISLNYTNTGGRISIFAMSASAAPILPFFLTTPAILTKVNVGDTVQLFGSADDNAPAPIAYRWQKEVGGNFVNLNDGGNISGVSTTNLTISNAGDADDGNYRLVATGDGGAANSPAATVTVISALQDVTTPGDSITAYQPNGGSSGGTEQVAQAIDNVTQKYLNNGNGITPMRVPVGFRVTPSMGRTRVTGLRMYTANDAAERDPANYILEGSDNGGATWTLIASNGITMPTGRNGGGQTALNPLTQNILQFRFSNTNGYTQYRWYTTRVKGNSSQMQIAEVELLGEVDTSNPSPFFTSQPTSMAAFEGGSASFNAFASGVPAPSHRWQKGTNGVYVNLSDGSRISGSQSGSLSISTLNLGDLADYICIATNVSGVVTSDVVRLTVVSTNVDVTMPGDPITGFGDISVGVWANTNPTNAINDINTAIYQNGGSGLNAQAGFPPFSGPVGLIVTPSVGSTRVVGLRIYTAGDTPGRDPADYKLEGSNDGGASYTIISSGSLALPDGRADNAQIFDPTVQPMQEILFANNASYTSYRLTFEHLKNDNGLPTVCLQIGEIELLGVAAPPSAVLSISVGAGGTLTISSTVNGQLYSTTNLTASSVWKDEGPITGSVVITPQPGEPTKFYQMR